MGVERAGRDEGHVTEAARVVVDDAGAAGEPKHDVALRGRLRAGVVKFPDDNCLFLVVITGPPPSSGSAIIIRRVLTWKMSVAPRQYGWLLWFTSSGNRSRFSSSATKGSIFGNQPSCRE